MYISTYLYIHQSINPPICLIGSVTCDRIVSVVLPESRKSESRSRTASGPSVPVPACSHTAVCEYTYPTVSQQWETPLKYRFQFYTSVASTSNVGRMNL